MRTRLASVARLAGITVAVSSVACSGPSDEVPAVAAGAPVVLISIDTLRADRLPVYGYGGVETPAIDAFRRDAVLFESAYSHVPLTLPSHTSVFTGMLPPEHGVRDNLGVQIERAGELPFLPRRLREAGYRTAAMVSTFVLQAASGISEGFEVYNDTRQADSQSLELLRDGAETLEQAKRWLDGNATSGPFLLFFHIYEPHTPYRPPQPFASRYADPYDGDVAYADRLVGELLERLKSLGVYDEALIVLFSDHGEGLGDHGEQEHGVFLYRETQWVPLLLKLPGNARAGDTISRPVGLYDIYPTVLELLDLEVESEVSGVSLLRDDVEPGRTIYAETYYPRSHLGWSELATLIGDRYQYIDAPRPELYDLDTDPAQQTNLIRDQRRVASELRADLHAIDPNYEPPGEADAETMAQLAALGYVGTVAEVDGPLADPKDKVHILEMLKDAAMSFQDGDFDAAAELFSTALDSEPQMLDAWEYYARAMKNSGRATEALEAYRRALEVSGGRPRYALEAAKLFFELGRIDEAEAHARLAVAGGETGAHALLGQAAVAQGDLEAADEAIRQAREAEVSELSIRRLEMNLAVAREDWQQVLTLSEQIEALAADPAMLDNPIAAGSSLLSGMYVARGRAQAQLGMAAEAEASFRREIELSPRLLASYTHLALLYAVLDRAPETAATLRTMVERNPHPHAYAEAVRTLDFMGDPRSAAGLLGQALGRWPADAELLALRAELAGG